jgi:hypothetical protein
MKKLAIAVLCSSLLAACAANSPTPAQAPPAPKVVQGPAGAATPSASKSDEDLSGQLRRLPIPLQAKIGPRLWMCVDTGADCGRVPGSLTVWVQLKRPLSALEREHYLSLGVFTEDELGIGQISGEALLELLGDDNVIEVEGTATSRIRQPNPSGAGQRQARAAG